MIFSREGFRAWRAVFLLALASVGVATFLIVGSYFYRQAETRNDQQSQRLMQDLRRRLETLRREREDLRNSENVYRALAARGVFLPEQRLDLVEALAELRNRHKLLSLNYEISQQRPLQMASGVSFTGVDVMGSRIKLKVRAYHDGDLLAFLNEFPRMQRGFFPIDRCVIKRSAEAIAQPGSGAVNPSAGAGNGAEPGSTATASAGLEAECLLDWVTLVDKKNLAPALQANLPKAPS
jgi:hypothetical protein